MYRIDVGDRGHIDAGDITHTDAEEDVITVGIHIGTGEHAIEAIGERAIHIIGEHVTEGNAQTKLHGAIKI